MSNPSLNDIYEAIGGLRSEVQASITKSKDQEKRLRSLEVLRSWGTGVVAALVFAYATVKALGITLSTAVMANGG